MSNSRSPYPMFRWTAKAMSILIGFTLFASLLPAAVFAVPASAFVAPTESLALATAKCTPDYQVRRGDTLQTIGSKFGYAPNQIVYTNGWKSPYTIYVGQNLCIPEKNDSSAPKLDSKSINSPAVYFTAGRSGSDILVYTYNYPKTTVLVKAGKTGAVGKNLSNLGSINIATVGNGKSTRFKLPAQLQSAGPLQVCLKDRATSYLQCVTPRSGS
jgi:hypothetical protein